MDKLKAYFNLFLILIVILLFATLSYFKKTDEILTARVIDSLENQNITPEIKQIKEELKFENRTISYSISQNCSLNSTTRLFRAMKLISDKTPIRFINKEDAEIIVECLNSSLKPKDDLSKISEGGPTLFYNNTILESRIVLYNSEEVKCDFPIAELHELLHALGFDHTTNTKSVMYPLAECKQELDREIIIFLNKLYSTSF